VRPEIRSQGSPFDKIERLEAVDIPDAIAYIVTRPRRESVDECSSVPRSRRIDGGLRRGVRYS